MSENPVCKTCKTVRVPMKNKRGTWYVGCPTCKGDKNGKVPPEPKKGEVKTTTKTEEKKTSGGFAQWLDSFLD